MKKLAKSLIALLLLAGTVTGCTSTTPPANDGNTGTNDPVTEGGTCSFENMTLEEVNKFLNESADLGEGSVGNVVAVVPINHVDGPRNETNFYAFVNFKYVARNYIKYQITYLSCTCRSADVNYWQTAYVELTLPDSKDIKDSEVRFLSFDQDSAGHYLGGFWGDSTLMKPLRKNTFLSSRARLMIISAH